MTPAFGLMLLAGATVSAPIRPKKNSRRGSGYQKKTNKNTTKACLKRRRAAKFAAKSRKINRRSSK